MEQNGMSHLTGIYAIMLWCSVQLATSQTVDPLSFPFDKRYGQVEVGGPFAGAEFHRSRPFPSRISLYYPAANTIDLSTDYWKRDESRPVALGIKIGTGMKRWIGREGWEYVLSPHTVTFSHADSLLSYIVKYEFCLNEPAMVISFSLKNSTTEMQSLTVYAHMLMTLRTCQTYARKDSATMSYLSESQSVIAQFNDADTRLASVFVMNAGENAVRSWNDANDLAVNDDGRSAWIDSGVAYPLQNDGAAKRTRAAAAFEYSRNLQPDETMQVVLIVGSASGKEADEKIERLSKNWMDEIRAYDTLVRFAASTGTHFVTGDQQIDRTLQWSKAILTTNAHYLDGQVVPMPCPAEYNFFFTHDLLMTNLGAVNFDLNRVKHNLLYIASLAQDSVIPHAYYWRDDGFKSELCTPSNWNHLWFIEVSAGYLRHSLDTATIRRLYPLITKSLNEVLTQLRDDHLMYAFRPDWWDIGWNEGPRTYITALGIRQIENFLYIASMIDRKNPSLIGLEKKTITMRSALVEKLWDDSLNYLINFNGKDKDEHTYMGSLLASAFDVLDAQRSSKMVGSVQKNLFAPHVGVRAAMPADFHTDSLIKYFKFAGKEAGEAYTYINGGVWPHNNAWFALALHAIGKSDEAKEFVKQTMTIDGVAQSPNGIPAMYEYRYSDTTSPRYGEIDKPSFLWAGGFYLYTMYALAGMIDNAWNLSFSEHAATFDSTIRASYSFSDIKNVEITGSGTRVKRILFDGAAVSSLVIPLDKRSAAAILVNKGKAVSPYVKSVSAIVHSAVYNKNKLSCVVSSYKGHATSMEVVSPKKPLKITVNGKKLGSTVSEKGNDGVWNTKITFPASDAQDAIILDW